MASTSRQAARGKKPLSRDSAASTDSTSSEESQDDFSSSDFSSESDPASRSPGPSASVRRVSTSYGNDVLPPRQKRIQFSPRREPGVHLTEDVGVALRSTTKRFLTALNFFPFFGGSDPNYL
ncbi:uncharacterized protein LOC144097154 [Amblyomma americanum]